MLVHQYGQPFFFDDKNVIFIFFNYWILKEILS